MEGFLYDQILPAKENSLLSNISLSVHIFTEIPKFMSDSRKILSADIFKTVYFWLEKYIRHITSN